MIQLSLKELAKYMTSDATAARGVLRERKLKAPESRARAAYYREARQRVRMHIGRDSRSPEWLQSEAKKLAERGARLQGRQRTRVLHNARAVAQYGAGFAEREWRLLEPLKLYLDFGSVRITVVPDLYVAEKKSKKIVKLEFSEDEQDEKVFTILSQGLFEAASRRQLDVTSSGVLVLDVARGDEYRGARLGSRLRRDMETACDDIEAVWDRIA